MWTLPVVVHHFARTSAQVGFEEVFDGTLRHGCQGPSVVATGSMLLVITAFSPLQPPCQVQLKPSESRDTWQGSA